MEQEKKQATALMRYSAIAPLINGQFPEGEKHGDYFAAVSEKGIIGPDGKLRHYAVPTLEKWLYSYRHGGFDALLSGGRSDAGKPRKLDPDLEDRIRYFKENYPRMPSAAIYRQLKDDGSILNGQVSESTVCRYVKTIETADNTAHEDLRRYERPHINEVWCGDSCYGPHLKTADGKRHRVYIIALIDDASRFITGADVFFADNFLNLMSVIRSAVSKFGRPSMFNFDNGHSYRNQQMELLAARIGSVIHYCQPYTPIQKAKIERWFKTLRDQWISGLDMRDFHSLDELRGSLLAYVQEYNNRPHSSLSGKTPADRFFSESDRIRRLDPNLIDKSFLLEIERRVSADCVITIDQVEYEVEPRFAKQRIRLRYSPDMEEIYVSENDGKILTPIRLLNKQENSLTKREKVRLCRGDEE